MNDEENAEIGKEVRIELIPVRTIKPLPLQFTMISREDEKMLLEDMRKGGLESIDPIRVRKLTAEEKESCREKYPFAEYEVIDGHKRLRNAELLQWESIRAIVMEVSREQAYEISYRKNKERGSIDPLLEALYFKKLYIEEKLPAFKIAERFNLTERYVRKIIQRINIDAEAVKKILTQAFSGRPLTGKHIDAITSAPQQMQPKITETIIKEGLDAKKTKALVEKVKEKPDELERITKLSKEQFTAELEKALIKTPSIETFECPCGCGYRLQVNWVKKKCEWFKT